MKMCIAFLFLLGLAPPASAGDETGTVPKPLHFRIEIAHGEGQTILGRLEASTEDGQTYDRAMLDLDGDGTPEKAIALENSSRAAGTDRFDVQVRFELKDMKWRLDLRGNRADPFKRPVYMFWSLGGPKGSVFFINGKVPVFPTAEEARKGKAVRLGPPFHFEVRSSTRGPDALVNVGLKDSNGSTLRTASRKDPASGEREETGISLAFLRNGKEGSPISAEYG